MRVVYWTRMPIARAPIVEGVTALPGVTLEQYEDIEELIAAMPGAKGLITFDAPADMARRVMEAARAPDASLRFMHVISAGREGYEAAGIPEGIHVTGADGAHSPTVAEHAVALMLALGRNLHKAAAMTAKGSWDRHAGRGMTTLEGRNVLVIGTGAAGRGIAQRTSPFGARLIGLSRSGEMKPGFDEVRPLAQLDTALSEADFAVIALALAPETRGLISAEKLALMKESAYLVNIARGAIVDNEALASALVDGRIAGAGIDVTEPEPLPDGHALWSAPNVIISPHVAGTGSDISLRRMAEAAINAVRRQLPA